MSDLAAPGDFAGVTLLVCGTGLAGLSAVRAALTLGAYPLVSSDGPVPVELPPGAEFVGALTSVPDGVAAVMASPGLPPAHPVLLDAAARGVPVFGELEFAWRIRGEHAADWLVVTGTNGKTTTVRMLHAMLTAAGIEARAVGNIGVSVIDAVTADPGYRVLAVEASSFQLHFATSLRPLAGALLNLAEDHLDWHGSMADYAGAKTKVWAGRHAIGNADDPLVSELIEPVAHPVLFTLAEPAAGRYGVRDGQLVDDTGHAFFDVAEVRPAGPHNVANALAAAALAATAGVPATAIAAGLLAFEPDPHRNQRVAEVAGVSYVDDSKATNPHAAAASLASYDRIVWIAGGQLKGASVDQLVADFAGRLAGAVLLGVDRAELKIALSRHAPDLPVIEVSRTDDGAMQDVVAAAASLARAGDVVLLAPAAASKDMFSSYGARGTAFSTAVMAQTGDPGRRP